MVARLEAVPELLRPLQVVADSSCVLRGDRLVVPCQQPAHDDHGAGPGTVSVRHTRAVRTAVSAAFAPVEFGALIDALHAEYPRTPLDTVEVLLTGLVANRILLTSLRPPMTAVDPLNHLLDELEAVDADHIPAVATTTSELRQIRSALLAPTHAEPGERRDWRTMATQRMRACASVVEQPLAVDVGRGCSLTLPQQVAREAEKTTAALARLTPFPAGPPAWQEYHALFLERGCEVRGASL